MFTKLRNKFLILNMSIISVLMIVAFAAVFISTQNNIKLENDRRIRILPTAPFSRTVEITTANSTFIPSNTDIISHENVISGGENISVHRESFRSFYVEVDTNGDILRIQSSLNMPYTFYTQAAEAVWNRPKDEAIIQLEGRQWQYRKISPSRLFRINGNNLEYTIQLINDGFQIVFLDVTDSYQMLNNLIYTFIFVGLSMLFVIFGISLYFANKAILPIQEAWEKQKQFVTDASHELKTPLAIIKANADVLLANQKDALNHDGCTNCVYAEKEWLDYIKIESDRMAKLVGDLLYLAKTENTKNNKGSMHYTDFDISDLVTNILLSMEAIMFEKNIQLFHTLESGVMLNGDPEQIKQVMMILFDNAIKYTPSKGTIHIALKKVKRCIIFSIQNSGRGIAKQELPKLFDRFYRTDDSRSRESGGYGLGLSIAKAIVEQMGGKIYVTSVENEGVTFTISFINVSSVQKNRSFS